MIKDRENKPDLIGFYMATNENAHMRKTPDNWMEWILSDKAHLSWQGLSAFDFVQSFEAIARAPHPTVIGYKKGLKGKIEPIFKSEQEQSRVAEVEDDMILSTMQKGIMEYINSYKYGIQLFGANASDTIPYAKSIMDVAIRFPKKEEAKILLSLRNSSDLGLNDLFSLGDNSAKKLFSFKTASKVLRQSFWRQGTIALIFGRYMQILFTFNEYRNSIPKQNHSLSPGVVWNSSNTLEEKKHVNDKYKKMFINDHYINQYNKNNKNGHNKFKVVLKKKFEKPLSFTEIIPSLFTFNLLKIYFKLKKGHHSLYYDGIGKKKLLVRKIFGKFGHKSWFKRIIQNL